MPVQLMELMRHKNIETTLRYYVGANAQRTAQSIWAAFQQQGQVLPPAPAGEVVLEAARNKTRNNDPSDHQKTTRPGVIRTHDQGIMRTKAGSRETNRKTGVFCVSRVVA